MGHRRSWVRAVGSVVALAGVAGLALVPAAAAEGKAGRPPRAPQPGRPALVFLEDAQGRRVGQVHGTFGGVALNVTIRLSDGRITTIAAGRDHFAFPFPVPNFQGLRREIAFEGGDCQGPPFLLAQQLNQYGEVAVPSAVGPDTVLYGPAGPLEPRVLGSRWNLDRQDCDVLAAEARDVFPVLPLLDLGAFAPPFRLALIPAEPVRLEDRALGLPPVIEDGAGREVGAFLGGPGFGGNGAQVAAEAGDGRVGLIVGPDGLAAFGTAMFESPGCQGAAFIRLDRDGTVVVPVLTPLATVESGFVLGTGSPESRLLQSYYIGECFDAAPVDLSVFPAQPTTALDHLASPFRVRR